jgi:hypothetical protein
MAQRVALLVASILAVAKAEHGQTCAEDSFTARCQLSADGGTPTFWSNETMWKRCVPKSCGVFPAVSNGATSAASVNVGDSVTLVCEAGYQVSGGDAVIRCEENCGFSHFPTCEPLTCPPTKGANTETITQGQFGESKPVLCDPGYGTHPSVFSAAEWVLAYWRCPLSHVAIPYVTTHGPSSSCRGHSLTHGRELRV